MTLLALMVFVVADDASSCPHPHTWRHGYENYAAAESGRLPALRAGPRACACGCRGWSVVVMTMHRLTAGAGYQYLLKQTASGDCGRSAKADLTAYYTASGNPPGRWYGRGLAALGGDGPSIGAQVSEPQMEYLFGQGKDPTTGCALGRPYPTYTPAADRIANQVAKLPPDMAADARNTAIATITRIELAKRSPTAVAGFDLTFTPTKSVSTLWAVSDQTTQTSPASTSSLPTGRPHPTTARARGTR